MKNINPPTLFFMYLRVVDDSAGDFEIQDPYIAQKVATNNRYRQDMLSQTHFFVNP